MLKNIKEISDIDIQEILEIIEDCEIFQDSLESEYSKEQEKKLAYEKIAELVRKRA